VFNINHLLVIFDLYDQTIFIATDIENCTIISRIGMGKDGFYISDGSPCGLCRGAIPMVQEHGVKLEFDSPDRLTKRLMDKGLASGARRRQNRR
jgi:hypothetical protein